MTMRIYTVEDMRIAALIGPEMITHGEGDDDWLYCICGNDPSGAGFYPCLANGFEVEPTIGGLWDGKLYVCNQCNRIVNQDTLEVVGRRSDFTTAYECADNCDTCWYLLTDTAEKELGEQVAAAKLRTHLESGHRLTSGEA